MFVNENGDIDAEEKEPTPTTISSASDKSQDRTALTTWVFENNSFVPQAKIVGDKTYSIVCDYLGTPVQAFNEKGENVWECELDIYGNIRNIEGSKTFIPFRYQGQYEDVETGLYYNRFRYYSPDTGTYISQDPIGLNSGEPNFYAYVHDSNSWIDPFGLTGIFSPAIWSATSPKGTGNTYKVFQQNIDWDIVNPETGLSNLDAALKTGKAPIGIDGESINLHHSKQQGHGPLFEMTNSTHKKFDRTNALHPYKVSGEGQNPFDPVNRKAFNNDRTNYWKDRARAEKARRSKLKGKGCH
ncbi:RHS repeat-associated core domain-containing protein [Algibacter lectus]|uniref:Rhs family protein n=1 Tax=Algibacter lectus TaxID=221126 RepID=A0A090VLW8_9FLAO|nr:RHS repeat-associated core domain-containing protein [Algibacter lectus]GAL64998.1 Rhs family protein [Algibacter lectus]